MEIRKEQHLLFMKIYMMLKMHLIIYRVLMLQEGMLLVILDI